MLDQEVSLDEIRSASTKLREGKSTADGWVPKMLTEVNDILYPILLIIFNTILQCSIFPCQWWYSVIIALFKHKGSRSVPKKLSVGFIGRHVIETVLCCLTVLKSGSSPMICKLHTRKGKVVVIIYFL